MRYSIIRFITVIAVGVAIVPLQTGRSQDRQPLKEVPRDKLPDDIPDDLKKPIDRSKLLLEPVKATKMARDRELLLKALGTNEKKSPNPRQKRLLRWTMVFDTKTGSDYASQLHALGAVLGVHSGDGKYRLIRDLAQRPAKPAEGDIRSIQRIFWIDDRADSVGPLAKALQLKETPSFIIAFFPESLEKELLEKELKFAGLMEKEIAETRFRVTKRDKSYTVVVESQKKVK